MTKDEYIFHSNAAGFVNYLENVINAPDNIFVNSIQNYEWKKADLFDRQQQLTQFRESLQRALEANNNGSSEKTMDEILIN